MNLNNPRMFFSLTWRYKRQLTLKKKRYFNTMRTTFRDFRKENKRTFSNIYISHYVLCLINSYPNS